MVVPLFAGFLWAGAPAGYFNYTTGVTPHATYNNVRADPGDVHGEAANVRGSCANVPGSSGDVRGSSGDVPGNFDDVRREAGNVHGESARFLAGVRLKPGWPDDPACAPESLP